MTPTAHVSNFAVRLGHVVRKRLGYEQQIQGKGIELEGFKFVNYEALPLP